MRYLATYYDGLTAQARPVAIAVTDTGVVISALHGAVLAHWPAEGVLLAERPRGGEPIRLGLEGTTERLVVDDPGVLETLRPVSPRLYQRVRTSWRGLARIVGWAGAAAGSMAVILLFVVPALSEQLAAVTPDTVRERIGGATLAQLVRLVKIDRSGSAGTQRPYCSDRPGRAALEALTARLTADMTAPPALRPVVLNTKLVNAFALPGNFIVLTKGLIESAVDAEEVAGVVAHEIGHIAHDHGIQRLYRSAAFGVLTSLMIGDVAGGLLVAGLGELMLDSGYSREAEREADRYALERLGAAGIDSRGFEAFFVRLQAQEEERRGKGGSALPGILSTHPPHAERIQAVRRAARSEGKVFEDSRQWPSLLLICRTTDSGSSTILHGR
ncbi:MAG: M48 family metallopeptidase [Deltaproteobacteria bacterium]|nr:M48 family metallopeptidase [Deltaproteobacteria bacterium]